MPTYEYECQACKYCLEVFQKITDSPLTQCEKCGKNALVKQISGGSFQLKGKGWYVTDFRDKKTAKSKDVTETKKESTKSETNTKPEKVEKKSESKIESAVSA